MGTRPFPRRLDDAERGLVSFDDLEADLELVALEDDPRFARRHDDAIEDAQIDADRRTSKRRDDQPRRFDTHATLRQQKPAIDAHTR
jgi:hypothetical protein